MAEMNEQHLVFFETAQVDLDESLDAYALGRVLPPDCTVTPIDFTVITPGKGMATIAITMPPVAVDTSNIEGDKPQLELVPDND